MHTNCIFCESKLDGSPEHIIPASLNGRLQTKQLICAKCNNKFGIQLDPIIKESLQTLLYLLDVGKNKKLKISDQEGKEYIIDRAGTINPVETEVKMFKVGDKIRISVSGEKLQAAKAFAKKAVRTFKNNALRAIETSKIELTESSLVPTELSVPFEIPVSSKLKLALQKISCEFYGFNQLEIELIRPSLEAIYNLDETNHNVVLCNFNQEIRKPLENEVSHLIIIRSDSNKKQVYCYLELFNVICAYSILIDNYEGEFINKVYHQDALTGEILKDEVDLRTDLVIADAQPDFEKLVNDVLVRKRNNKHIDMVAGTLTGLKKKLDEELSNGTISEVEHREKYVKMSANAIAEMMVYAFPDDIDDFSEEDEKRVNYIHSIILEDGIEDFNYYYNPLIGKEYDFTKEHESYILQRFVFTKHAPKKNKNRLKVVCRCMSLDGHKTVDIPCNEFFTGIGLDAPEIGDAIWL